ILAAAAPMDEHGYFSLGTQADYVASFIGKVPFFLEVNPNMPRTFGANQVHISQVLGYIDVDYPLHEAKEPKITEIDRRIAAHVVE
ncbi:propionyl-CoA--succinate CoA transferase, partial [Cohnella sp. REN36]|nr:propionyl-CoA--succinate CoA transferase [Cohnella sp. REN36]